GVNALVVDADACRLDVLVDDRQHRRLLPRQGDLVVDAVLEVVADLVGGGDRGDAGAGVEGSNRAADAPGVGAGDLLLPAALLELIVVQARVEGVVGEVIIPLRLPLAALLTELGAEVAELGAVAEVAVHELQLIAVDERIHGVHTALQAELAAEAA